MSNKLEMGEIDDIFNKTAKATKLRPITSDDLKRTKEEQPSGVQVGSSKKSLKKSKRKAHNGLTSNSRSQAKQSNSKAAECLDFKNDSVETVEFQPLVFSAQPVKDLNDEFSDSRGKRSISI